MAVGNDKIADLTVNNYAALKLKHPQRETGSVPDPTDLDYFSTSEFFVHKTSMSSLNGSSACLDGFLPQVLKKVTVESNGQTGRNSVSALTIFVKGEVPFEMRPFLFGAQLIALKKAR